MLLIFVPVVPYWMWLVVRHSQKPSGSKWDLESMTCAPTCLWSEIQALSYFCIQREMLVLSINTPPPPLLFYSVSLFYVQVTDPSLYRQQAWRECSPVTFSLSFSLSSTVTRTHCAWRNRSMVPSTLNLCPLAWLCLETNGQIGLCRL